MSHGSGSSRPPPRPLNQNVVLRLKELWEHLPAPNRDRVLDDLSRLIEQQLTSPRRKEVSGDDS
jgi:hypothetical protein